MEEKNQNIEEKKDLTQEEIKDVQGGLSYQSDLVLDPSDAQFVDVIHTDASPMLPSLG